MSISAASFRDNSGSDRHFGEVLPGGQGTWRVLIPVGAAAYSSVPLQNIPGGFQLAPGADPFIGNKPGPVWQSQQAGSVPCVSMYVDDPWKGFFSWSRQDKELPEITPFSFSGLECIKRGTQQELQ